MKDKSRHQHPDCSSAVEPIPRSNDFLIPLFLPTDVFKEEAFPSESQSSIEASDFVMYAEEKEQHDSILFSHILNDLVRDVDFPKEKTWLLNTRLK